MTSDLPSDEDFAAAMQKIINVTVKLAMPAPRAFQLLAVIQLASRHPCFTPQILEGLGPLIVSLEDQIDHSPTIRKMINAGWDSDHDVAPAAGASQQVH